MTTNTPPTKPAMSRRGILAGVPLAVGAIYGGSRWLRSPEGTSPAAPTGATPLAPEAGPLPAGFQRLRAAPGTAMLLPDASTPTQVWAYEGSTPGPELRVTAGERVQVRLENALPQDTAVHWHGISIANQMDGVPGLTQEAVPPGEVFDYDFVAPHPGTYWYHTHDRSWEQNARGLHGPLIIEEDEAYAVDREVTVLVEDWRLDDDGRFDEESLGSITEWSHDGRTGNVLTVNGQVNPRLAVTAGERIRFRLVSTANARIMGLSFGDLPATIIALDGFPLAPRPVDEYVLLSPAQRADIVVDLTGNPGDLAVVELLTQNGSGPGIQLAYGTDEPIRTTFPDVPSLPARPGQAPLDLADAMRVELVMEGGAMGGMRSAMHNGRMMGMDELLEERRFWAFNGVAGDLDEPLATVDLGKTVVMTIRNDTSFPHAMHLHGHHFRVLTRGDEPDPTQDWRDTELMGGGETIEIAFLADNPGKWLLHCHMLEHSAAGMITWLDVV